MGGLSLELEEAMRHRDFLHTRKSMSRRVGTEDRGGVWDAEGD